MKKLIVLAMLSGCGPALVMGCASIDKAYVAKMEAKRKALEALYQLDLKSCAGVPQADKDAWERNFRSWQALNEEALK